MRRRALPAALFVLVDAASAAIVGPGEASRRVRHRLKPAQVFALAGHRLTDRGAMSVLGVDFRRLLGPRFGAFLERLGAEVPMHRVGDVVMGEGTRTGGLGHDASLFVVARDGALFAVVKSGAFGVDIERFGSTDVLADWNVRHRYLEFTDLDE